MARTYADIDEEAENERLEAKKCCHTCSHFEDIGLYQGELGYLESPFFGHCRRHPPKWVEGSDLAVWPRVMADWKCGEYDDVGARLRAEWPEVCGD